MLPAGHRAELVDPSNPALRVEVTAPPDRALDINALLGESKHSGIFAGLSRASRAANAQRATLLPDGRIVLVSGHPPGTGKSVEHAHHGHAELRQDKDNHIRGMHNHGSRELHREHSRDGEALAQEHDRSNSARKHKSGQAKKDTTVSRSPTTHRVSSQESTDEDKGLTTVMRSVDDQPPRLCI